MRKARFLISLSILILFGCVAPQQLTISTPFNETDCEWVVGSGTSTIVGSAFLKTRGGDVKVGAGNLVELIPSTPYTRERFQVARNNSFGVMPPRPMALAKYIRSTRADAQGSFEFSNIPAGDYIIACIIQWEVPSGMTMMATGGQALAFTTVAPGQTQRVVVTR